MSLGPSCTEQILEKYSWQLLKVWSIQRKQACIDGSLLGLSLFTRFAYFIAVLWIIGAVARNQSPIQNVSLVLFQAIIFFSSYAEIEYALQRLPSRDSGDSARRVFRLIDELSLVDVRDEKPRRVIENGAIEFR